MPHAAHQTHIAACNSDTDRKGKAVEKEMLRVQMFIALKTKEKEEKRETSLAKRKRSSFDAIHQRLGEALHGRL